MPPKSSSPAFQSVPVASQVCLAIIDELESLACQMCDRCECGDPFWPETDSEPAGHGVDVFPESGVTKHPEPCAAEVVWKRIAEIKRKAREAA